MLEQIIQVASHFIINTISTLSYPGVVLLMAIESCCIPLPSEIIMPFSGYLVYLSDLNLWAVSFAGALGCLIGSWVAYAFGFYGRERIVRHFIKRWGKYVLMSEHELDAAEKLFKKYGSAITFVSRLLPGIRTYISLPAGFSQMNFAKFSFYTFTGSLIWCYLLALIGLKLGENWNTLGPIFHRFDAFIIGTLILAAAYYIYSRLKKSE